MCTRYAAARAAQDHNQRATAGVVMRTPLPTRPLLLLIVVEDDHLLLVCGRGRWMLVGPKSVGGGVMTHKNRGSIVVLLISKSVELNEEQNKMTISFQ